VVHNRSKTVVDLNVEVDITSVWENSRTNIKFSAKESLDYYELRKYKPW
jgi:hypothetical protein